MSKNKHQLSFSPRIKLGLGYKYNKNQALKIFSFTFLTIAIGLVFNSIWVISQYEKKPTIYGIENITPQVLGVTDTETEITELEYIAYQVKTGDTLFNVSQKFNINWITLATLNNLKSPFSLKPGQTIKIPK